MENIFWFTILLPPDLGEIRVQKDNALDFEASPQIQLVVLADSGMQTAHCRVIITLLDINDNAPQFEHSSYRTSVWEGQVRNTYIMQVHLQHLRKNLLETQINHGVSFIVGI